MYTTASPPRTKTLFLCCCQNASSCSDTTFCAVPERAESISRRTGDGDTRYAAEDARAPAPATARRAWPGAADACRNRCHMLRWGGSASRAFGGGAGGLRGGGTAGVGVAGWAVACFLCCAADRGC